MSQPKLNDARRILVEAQQQLEKYERALQNTLNSIEAEQRTLERLKVESAAVRQHAAEDAQSIRAAARADAERLTQDTKASLADAITQRKAHTEAAETIIREAQEKAEMALNKNTQEMVDLVAGLSFLRQESDRLAGERNTLEGQIEELVDRKHKLEVSLEVLERKFDSVTKGLK